ncbi:pancreatic lipase-related protein 2-like [Amblyomma americanum]
MHQALLAGFLIISASVVISVTPATTKAGYGKGILGTGIALLRKDGSGREKWNPALVDLTIALIKLIKALRRLPLYVAYRILSEYIRRKTNPKLPSPRVLFPGGMVSRLMWKLKGDVKTTLVKQALNFINIQRGNHTCFHELGCFDTKNRLALPIGGPANPYAVGTRLTFFGGRNATGVRVNHITWKRHYKRHSWNMTKPFAAIIHGFTESGNAAWMHQMKDAFIQYHDFNVIIVDWGPGAAPPNYAIAAANTPVPGAQLSLLLNKMAKTAEGTRFYSRVHLVGFSLGAQAAGFCGRHYYKATGSLLNRITGLDPAGPLFRSTKVELSKTDAKFVDIIHTNAGNLKDYKFGIMSSTGHVDFHPNGGSNQPNCTDRLKDVGCSHGRAPAMFIESLKIRKCSFKAYTCKGGWKQYRSCKQHANPSNTGEMGYWSINRKGRGDEYLETCGSPPYCIS